MNFGKILNLVAENNINEDQLVKKILNEGISEDLFGMI